MATYIREIKIEGLWGIYDLRWEVAPGVNILSGGNGSGKSTVLRCLADMFREGRLSQKRERLVAKVVVTFDDGTTVDSKTLFDPSKYESMVVSTFDVAMKESDAIRKITNGDVITELDWELYQLHSEYLGYQLEVSKEVIEALTAGRSTDEVLARKTLFFDIVDSLFESTGKKIDRQSNSLTFMMGHRRISPYQLSSGEKQMIILLTSVLVRNNRPVIMIMDEPEISLHFDWQKRLVSEIVKLNPNVQLIIATHSPAVVMDGWIDCVSEMSELIVSTSIP